MAKSPVNLRLEKAASLHHAGKLEEAERLYDQVLALDRSNPDALNLKGVIANVRGRYAEALPLFDRAIAALPSFPDMHFNRGLALAGLGRNEEALEAYSRAISLNPAYSDARLNAGLLLHTMGRSAEAIGVFRVLTQLAPQDARGFYNLAVCLEKSLAAAPEAARPQIAGEARAAFMRAIALDPRNPDTYFAFANLHTFLGEYTLAAERLSEALALDPNLSGAWNNLASQYEALGRREDAIAAFTHALELNPADAAAAVNRGMTYLAQGRLAEGWEGYARRFEDPRFPFVRRDWPWPQWRGEDLRDKSILIWSDQGIGDEVLYSSMLAEAEAMAGGCVIECAPRLLPLYKRSFPFLEILPNSPETRTELLARSFHFQSSVLDLGRWLRPRLSSFPNRPGVLKADLARAEELRVRYRGSLPDQRLVGISWRSIAPAMAHQKGRPLTAFLPLLAAKKFTFVNLQYGQVTDELAALKTHHGIDIIHDNHIDSWKDLDGFAAQLAALDAVVTISNTTAHMAGALGVPTCLYVPQGSKQLWYWFETGAYSPWYTSIRIFRRPLPQGANDLRQALEAW